MLYLDDLDSSSDFQFVHFTNPLVTFPVVTATTGFPDNFIYNYYNKNRWRETFDKQICCKTVEWKEKWSILLNIVWIYYCQGMIFRDFFCIVSFPNVRKLLDQ